MYKPLAVGELKLTRTYSVGVYMWADEKQVTKAYRQGGMYSLKRGNKAFAFFKWEATQDVYKNGKLSKPRSKNLGDLHFSIKHMGAGIVAHEIQHLVLRWCQTMGWDWKDDKWQEPIADLTQRVTSRYWTWFYKNFEGEPASG